MIKRLIALSLILVLSLSVFGCTPNNNTITTQGETVDSQTEDTIPENTEGYDKIERSLLDFSTDLYTSAELSKGYESLKNDAQRKCYKLLKESVFYISQEAEDGVYHILPVTVEDTVLTEAELHLVISAYSLDHPEVFWIDNSFSYYSNSKETYLRLSSALSAQEVIESAQAMYAELREIFSGLPGNLSEFDRELFVHDKLIERCEYADESVRSEEDHNIYTSLGAIVDSVAVCEGYSRATQLLLSLVGIESYYVYGRGNNELHMWNNVRLSDNWYYLDVTWDDKGENGSSYNYFNITTQQALSERTIAPLYGELTDDEIIGSDGEAVNFNFFVPLCNLENMSYYAQNCVTVTGFDSENLESIANAMVDTVQRGQDAVYLYIDPYYLDFEDAKDNLFYSGDYAIFTCIEMANDILSGATISDEYVSTEEAPELSVLTVYLEYE